MVNRRDWLTGATLALAGAEIGAFRAPAFAQSPSTVRVGIIPVEPASEVIVAQAQGLFAKAGIDATIQPAQGGSAIAAAVTGGSLDIGWSAVDVLAQLYSKGIPITIVAAAGDYVNAATDRTMGLVVASDSPIKTAKDLNGKTVAANALHGLGETNVKAWVDKNGGDSSTIKFIELPLPAMAGAIDSGRIQAGTLLEPFLSTAAATHRVLTYGFSVPTPALISAYFTSKQWANANAAVLERFVGAIYQAGDWCEKNRAASNTIVARFTKIDPEVVAKMAHTPFAQELTPALVQPLIDLSAKYNGFAPYPAHELIYSPKR